MKLDKNLWDVAIKALDDVKGLPDEVVAEWATGYVCGSGQKFP